MNPITQKADLIYYALSDQYLWQGLCGKSAIRFPNMSMQFDKDIDNFSACLN